MDEVLAYMPKQIICGKCKRPVEKAIRRQIKKQRFIEVHCHRQMTRVGFASDPNQQVTAWPSAPPTPSPSSN